MALRRGCSIPTAELLDSSTVGIELLVAHAAESILCMRGGDVALPKLLCGFLSELVRCCVYVYFRLVLGMADADVSLQQYCCCLLYQCLLTDPRHYIQRLVHSTDGKLPLMCAILSYLVDHDCEWGSVSQSSAVCGFYVYAL